MALWSQYENAIDHGAEQPPAVGFEIGNANSYIPLPDISDVVAQLPPYSNHQPSILTDHHVVELVAELSSMRPLELVGQLQQVTSVQGYVVFRGSVPVLMLLRQLRALAAASMVCTAWNAAFTTPLMLARNKLSGANSCNDIVWPPMLRLTGLDHHADSKAKIRDMYMREITVPHDIIPIYNRTGFTHRAVVTITGNADDVFLHALRICEQCSTVGLTAHFVSTDEFDRWSKEFDRSPRSSTWHKRIIQRHRNMIDYRLLASVP